MPRSKTDLPSQQLNRELHEYLDQADRDNETHSNFNPKLTHLNADTTWLLQLPVPTPAKASSANGRRFYNILIDPWLDGPQSDGAKWFSQQWHAIESKVRTVKEAEKLAWEIEERDDLSEEEDDAEDSASSIDAVVISHEFTDHCHQDTLLTVPRDVPVFATVKAAALIRSWEHFDHVVDIANFTTRNLDWRSMSSEHLPDWLRVSRIASEGSDLLYYHSAIMITFLPATSTSIDSDEAASAVIYTPHGVEANDVTHIPKADPPIQTLALLHGLHDISIGTQLNLGAHNGLKAQRLINAKYWIATHDEVKKGGGLVSFFLKRKVYTLQEALEHEATELGDEKARSQLANVNFVDLGNGDELVLV